MEVNGTLNVIKTYTLSRNNEPIIMCLDYTTTVKHCYNAPQIL